MELDEVARYLEVFEQLRRHRRWSTDTGVLRFAALSLAAADLRDPAAELERAADELKQRTGRLGLGPLASSIRYAVAALILRRGLRPGSVHDHVETVRKTFRRHRFRRGGIQEVLAALILVLQNEGRAVPAATVERMQEILRRWKEDHPWLTGPDDYPTAALHASRPVAPESVGLGVERIYQALRTSGCRRGNQLQLASHILTLADGSAESAARRFDLLVAEMKRRGERVRSGRYDEMALLTLTSGTPSSVIDLLLLARDRLRAVRPKPASDLAFSLAAGLVLSREVGQSKTLEGSRDVAAVAAAQALLDVQNAAMVAVMAGAMAGVTAATSAAH